jgi:hypothetical protein
MTPAVGRFVGVVNAQGEPFTVSGVDHLGVFSVIPSSSHLSYLTQAEVDGASKPIWLVLVSAIDSTSSGATLIWNGGSWTVMRILPLRHKGETVAKMLVIA